MSLLLSGEHLVFPHPNFLLHENYDGVANNANQH